MIKVPIVLHRGVVNQFSVHCNNLHSVIFFSKIRTGTTKINYWMIVQIFGNLCIPKRGLWILQQTALQVNQKQKSLGNWMEVEIKYLVEEIFHLITYVCTYSSALLSNALREKCQKDRSVGIFFKMVSIILKLETRYQSPQCNDPTLTNMSILHSECIQRMVCQFFKNPNILGKC